MLGTLSVSYWVPAMEKNYFYFWEWEKQNERKIPAFIYERQKINELIKSLETEWDSNQLRP